MDPDSRYRQVDGDPWVTIYLAGPSPEAPDKLNAELGALSLLPTGFFYADEVKRPTIHIKVAVTVELIESIEASAMLACRPVTNDW